MSSIPYIEIDWSSTPRQPYVQLGDPTPPENDSANILHNTELTTVLSSEDIFFLDIDDIYPYTYSTLHLDDNEMEETYDDEDYFEQLLNAEIEEISCIKHDTPSISSTPLTPIQDNIPLPPPNTAPISDNLLKVRKNTTLQVSPEKFHVTTPKRSGYNEIYEIRRSKMTVLDKDSYNKKSLHKIRNIFAYSFQTHKLNPYIVMDTRGSGTLYNIKKSRYFLMELHPNADLCLTKKNSFNVYTNDIDMPNDHQRIFNSTSKKVNLNYLIGTYLTFIFSINRQFSPEIVQKYFKRLRQLLIDKLVAIKNRLSYLAKNRQTKTYIRFSSGTHVIYLGFYFRCSHTCTQPAAFVLPNNQWQCNKHFTPIPELRKKTTHRKGKDHNTVNFNPWKEVHSTRLGLKYNVIVKRYNKWKGKNNSDLKEVMEPITTNRKGKSTTRPFYKEYKDLEFYDNRTPQQVKRWNRLKESTIKHEKHLSHCKPFLLKENSTVFKKVSHLVKRDPSYEKSEEDKLLDQLTRKRAKNWRRRVNNCNKLKKKLPELPVDFSGDAQNYYFQTYNINLFAYKVRRRYDLSNIPQCQYGYLKAKRLYNNHMDRKNLRPPIIRQSSPPQIISQPIQPEIDFVVDYALKVVQYENARAKLALHENPTDFKTLAPLLVKPTLPSMVYPSAKEKARLNALANDETSSPNSNQSINDLLPRQIARPRSKKKILSTDTVDNCNTPPPGPSRTTTDSPPRLIA
ncbi:hypothetical protein GLOIN_2v1788972 [Rhizophagus irregularis DAOM 181602=DAOM 197198]|uniref:Uncharacterized protein n=3 Tax=Rhizophagus irregularis TaxID=588596 RepID=A0A015IJV1_RHIIW|nr:hypothetical protein GLOIN_2v1788972 [Rhizophagus irregularis DAOM 181602=DAOM 197198]EXX57437.1 hypothetical protein RirG_207200 [Rhizophagus irregularis DAOM 197198w]POG59542.1 hypothetical protein GLOIN_2v1788972 [Rhizophagus irregularis DAOM 181602=DAOM 197198]GBC38381.1 hypothetical protein GLOIN_2v1788972 [Rhizophagus irregularis DAOM 181602=DAOM 197198]|eukprot:XP_025166408.1 hypothetical protein GLOIN_2v1788972 [Rhizophagus irregularis DAOM 181602=DAOM 197198]